jgi:putative ABC transport system substrate-binding protein
MRWGGSVMVAWALALAASPAAGQEGRMPVVGFLRSTPPEPFGHLVEAFRAGLRETGYVENENVRIEYRYADNDFARLPALATDLMGARPAVIVGNRPAVQAVRSFDEAVPIVFVLGDDPVESGVVTNLNRPGGSTTGVTFFGGGSLDAKRLELLHEIIPRDRTVAVLVDGAYSGRDAELPSLHAAARSLGRTLAVVVADPYRMDAAFEDIAKASAGALLVSGSPSFASRRHELVALASRYSLPASYDQRAYVEVGGLMSYGADFPGAYRIAGTYVGRILSGDRPGDLPVVQPTTFEFAINLKTAKALGLEVPLTLLARADEVIE